MEVTIILKLDYTLTSAEERLELVNKILEENKEPNEAYLEVLAEYLVIPIEREERRQHKILTDNRMATVNKRETSFEGRKPIANCYPCAQCRNPPICLQFFQNLKQTIHSR